MDDGQRCDASLAVAFDQRLDAWIDNAAKCEIGLIPCKHDVPKPCLAPNGDAPRELHDDVARGSEVSLRGFLQNRHIQSLIGH